MDGLDDFMSQTKAYAIQMNVFLTDLTEAGFTREEAFKMVLSMHTEKLRNDFRNGG